MFINRHKKVRNNDKSNKYGANLINDVSGFNYDINSLKKLKK